MKGFGYMQDILHDTEYSEEIEAKLFSFSWQTYHIMRIIICVCQLAMCILLCAREGGPFYTARRISYLVLYGSLFVVTLVFIGVDALWNIKKWKRYQTYMNLGFVYVLFVMGWSCGITLLDQKSGGGLTVYTYMLLMVAALTVLKSWQGITLFMGSFLVLNVLLPYFPSVAAGVDQSFNYFVNSLVITGIAFMVSITFNRWRIISYRDQKIIAEQNKKLCEINEQLRREIIVDNLTGLYNRKYLSDMMHLRFHESASTIEGIPITCLMTDVDYFKKYNDTYGHQKGDECLKKIAEIIKRCFSMESAKAIRYGGEEFVIFIFNCSQEQAVHYAEDFRGTVVESRLVRKDVEEGYLTVSMGIYTEIPDKDAEMSEFIRRADEALYDAKRAGRNCIKLYQNKAS